MLEGACDAQDFTRVRITVIDPGNRLTMKTLIVEDDFTSRVMLQQLIKGYGISHVAVNGKEAIEAVSLGFEAGEPYDLVCLDIMLPEMDGHQVLKEIRRLEAGAGLGSSPLGRRTRVIMTTTASSQANVEEAVANQCDAFLVKPIDGARFIAQLSKMQLIW